MSQLLLLGDEALAQGAIDAGLSGCYAYPGTPSTEIMEFIRTSAAADSRRIHREWSCNEKVAMEEALGMSYAGKRSMVCMKHVGLNVAADGFINAAITGCGGGLVVTVADDPSMHSSQNEQDSRFYAQFAMVPCLEPANQQESYDMAAYAFDLSERLQTPVMLRLTTRLSHSRANISRAAERPENPLALPGRDERRYILLPAIAKQNYKKLCAKQESFQAASAASPFNAYHDGGDRSWGIIASGITWNYLQEAFAGQCPYPVLKISQYPLPLEPLQRLVASCQRVMVVEEGMPFIETQLRGLIPNPAIRGRLTGELPRDGELNSRLVRQAFGLAVPSLAADSAQVRPRPPKLCDGCPHILSYQAINEVIADQPGARVFGDIGCYTLGALPPFNAISTCLDMGGSITMAKGAADAGVRPAIAVIGDSTFTHSGMTGLLDAVWENTPLTLVIVDNYTTGMTGGQDSLGSGRLDQICLGLGVTPEHLHILVPLPARHAQNVDILRREAAYAGLSVVIFRRECIQTARKK